MKACLLHLRDGVQGQRGLAAGFRAVDLDDAALGVAPDTERDVEADRARGHDDDVVREGRALLEAHDRALAVFLLDAGESEVDGLRARLVIHEWAPRMSGVFLNIYWFFVQVSRFHLTLINPQ
jgi:hypothetical protein